MSRTWLRRLGLALVLPLVAAACTDDGSSGAEAPATSITEPDVLTAEAVTTSSSEAMGAIDSVAFVIDQQGAEVYLDEGQLVQFVRAEGRYGAPSSADALVTVTLLGAQAEVGAIAIDGEVWITNPLTGAWESAGSSFAFDPALIFSSTVGLGALIGDGLVDPELAQVEPDADGHFVITAGVDPARVEDLTSGLVSDVSDVDLRIDADTWLVDEVSFLVVTEEGAPPSSWRMVLTDYDADVDISPPDMG